MNLIAQAFGLGAMVSLFLAYQQKSREKLIGAKLSADLFWIMHYLLLGGTAGMIPNFVGMFREIVFINRKNKKWAGYSIWPIIFIVINWGLGIHTFHSVFNILPIMASTFVTISLWIDNPKITKAISVPVSLAFLIYDFYICSYIGMLNESIAIGSILISLTKGKERMRGK